MKIYDIDKIHNWFGDYVSGFAADGGLPDMMEMKRKHSYDVEGVGRALASEMGWDGDAVLLGTAAALLHDTGRFSQYRDFGTFTDGMSVDHGERGFEELRRAFPREFADGEGYSALLESTRWHNKKELPEHVSGAYLPYCKLVRDADKIDVFRLVQDYIDRGKVETLLPRHRISEPLSESVLDEIAKNGVASYKNASSLADFLILQITWLLDINYAASMRMLDESGAAQRIIGQLKPDKRAGDVLNSLLGKVDAHRRSLR